MTENNAPLFKNTDPDEAFNAFDLSKITRGIRRHTRILLICAGVCGLFGFKFAKDFLLTYQATAILLFQGDKQGASMTEGGLDITNLNKQTTIEMIKMPRHFEAIKINLGLDLSEEKIQSMIDIPEMGQRMQTNLIDIVVKADNPHLAVDVANSLAKTAVKTSQDFRRKQLTAVLNSYQSQLSVLRQTSAFQGKEIEDFKDVHQYFEMDPGHSVILARVSSLREQKNQAVLKHSTLAVEYENLKKEIELLPEYVPLDREAKGSPLQMRILNLETALATANAKYTNDNPKVKRLEMELNELTRKSRNQSMNPEEQFYEKNEVRSQLELEVMRMQGQVKASQKVIEELATNLQVAEKQLEKLPERQMSFVKLLSAKQVTDSEIERMAKAVEHTQLLIDYPSGNLAVYLLAKEGTPWANGFWVYLLPFIGALGGLFLGSFVALVMEVLDRKFRTQKELEGCYNIPCITVIPELKNLRLENVKENTRYFIRSISEFIDKELKGGNNSGANGINATSGHNITNGKNAHNGINGNNSEAKVISIVSSVSEEGKSLIATYLAKHYQRQQKRVLILELDHRKNPFMKETSHNLDMKQQLTINEYLKGNMTIDKLIYRGEIDLIMFLESDPEMADLVTSKKMDEFWKVIRSKYDIIIVDTPGVIEEEYTESVAAAADLTLMVINSSGVDKSLVDESLKALDFMNARPSGIVLNRVDPVYITDARIISEMKKLNGYGYVETKNSEEKE